MADAMVLATQKWLNEKYGNDSRFNKVAEDGITGWGTIYGLRRALQIEEKLPSLSNNFGQSTYAKCPTVKKGDTGNLVYIVQGGLWCKGYSPGGFNGVYGDGTYAAVQRFKKAAGFDDADGNIDKDFMKALLDMSAFKLLSGGTDAIRTIQQQLNKDYYDFYQICPCNGLYDRDMNKMLIYALQKEEGIPKASATGTWGPSTISKCPTLELGKSSNVVKLVRYALVCNGISVDTSSKTYDSTLDAKAKEFAKLLKLNKKSNVIDYTIIKSLLSSNGDPNRSAKGCDTATKLTKAQIQTIKNAGYEYVGRYLSNTPGGTLDKALTKTEVKNILNVGLRLFYIFQESNNAASKFTSARGKEQAERGIVAAHSLGIPYKSVIYFAVDCDPTDSEITNYILPYFRQVVSIFKSKPYTVGVYGTRNVCNKLRKQLGITKLFVSDASYGFSGNLGYIMPDEWCFDQFKTDITIGSGDGKVSIDKVGISGNDICDYGNMIEGSDKYEFYYPGEDDYADEIYHKGVLRVNLNPNGLRVYCRTRSDKEDTLKGRKWSLPYYSDLVHIIPQYAFYLNIGELSETNDLVDLIAYRASDGTIKYGYIAVSNTIVLPGSDKYVATVDSEIKEDIKNLYYQEDFTSYTVNTGDYTLKKANKEKIDNAYHTIYKLKRDVKLYDIKRNYKGVMSAGTIIAISESYSGNTDNTLVRVNRVLNENDEWIGPVKKDDGTYEAGYIEYQLNYGDLPFYRTINN